MASSHSTTVQPDYGTHYHRNLETSRNTIRSVVWLVAGARRAVFMLVVQPVNSYSVVLGPVAVVLHLQCLCVCACVRACVRECVRA